MADRATLHRSKLKEFVEWVRSEGWEVEDGKGSYEVLRLSKTRNGKVTRALVHERSRGDHLSVHGQSARLVRRWLHSRRQSSTGSSPKSTN